MKMMTRVSTVAVATAAAAVLAGGVASAAVVHGPGSAGTTIPTTNYTMCGTVFQGASNPSSGNPLPSGAAAIEGVQVTGTLYNVLGGVAGGPYVATSAADGTYCFTGSSAMSSTIAFGGKVVLAVNPTTVGATSAQLPYGGTIRTAQFLTHKVSGLDSASGLNIAYN